MKPDRQYKMRDLHPSGDGRMFWCYQPRGQEYWVTPEVFDARRQKQWDREHSPEGKAKRQAYSKAHPKTKADIIKIGEWKKAKRKDPEYRAKENATNSIRIKRPEVKAKLKAYQKEYHQRTNARLAGNARSRIKAVLAGKVKTSNTMKLLGCNAREFMAHLQSHFEPRMEFNNYGEWHVDHIIPLAMFDLTKPDHQRIAFNFRNCRPAWASENLSKKDKLDRALISKHDLTEALKLINS